jgi:hypothetical protein
MWLSFFMWPISPDRTAAFSVQRFAPARRLHAGDQDRIALPQIRERRALEDIGASISTT